MYELYCINMNNTFNTGKMEAKVTFRPNSRDLILHATAGALFLTATAPAALAAGPGLDPCGSCLSSNPAGDVNLRPGMDSDGLAAGPNIDVTGLAAGPHIDPAGLTDGGPDGFMSRTIYCLKYGLWTGSC